VESTQQNAEFNQQSWCPTQGLLWTPSTGSFKEINKTGHRKVTLTLTQSIAPSLFFLKKISAVLESFFLFQRFCPFLRVLAKKFNTPVILRK